MIVIGNKARKSVQVELVLANSAEKHALTMSKSESVVSETKNNVMMDPAATNATFETTCHDLTQYTIESLQLTPFISASFSLPSTSLLSNRTLTEPQLLKRSDLDTSNVMSTSQKGLQNSCQVFRSNSQKNITESSFGVDETVQIISAGQDAKIIFPVLCCMQTKTFELSFSNNWNQHVYWRAYPPKQASYRAGDFSSLDGSSPLPTALNQPIFTFTPASGKMAPSQVERVKIEFSPRELHGSFAQVWDIETRIGLDSLSDSFQLQPGPTLFSCQLHLFGRSAIAAVQLEKSVLDDEKNFFNRVDNRLFKSKATQPQTELLQSCNKSDISKSKRLSIKENIPENNVNKTTNATCFDLLSSSSLANSSASIKATKLYTKQSDIIFPDTLPNQSMRSYITISNPEKLKFILSAVKPRDSFFCKIEDTVVSAGHYIKIPVEFRPLAPGIFKDKIIFSVKNEGRPPLFCNLIGKCVSSIQNLNL